MWIQSVRMFFLQWWEAFGYCCLVNVALQPSMSTWRRGLEGLVNAPRGPMNRWDYIVVNSGDLMLRLDLESSMERQHPSDYLVNPASNSWLDNYFNAPYGFTMVRISARLTTWDAIGHPIGSWMAPQVQHAVILLRCIVALSSVAMNEAGEARSEYEVDYYKRVDSSFSELAQPCHYVVLICSSFR